MRGIEQRRTGGRGLFRSGRLGGAAPSPRLCVLAVLVAALLALGSYVLVSVPPAVAGDVLPTVTALSPDIGSPAGGTRVTITGTGFVAGSTTVAFGSLLATDVTVTSPITITATAPAHPAGSVDVTVRTPHAGGGRSATDPLDLFAYGAPSVTSLSPSAGPTAGGTVVTITGASFAPDANVFFGTSAATDVLVTSATTMVATAPASVAGGGVVDVTVSTPGSDDGSSTSSVADLFAYGAPTVTAITPDTGSVGASTPVTITGTDFSPGDTVDFGATPASAVTVRSSGLISARSPVTLRGGVEVTATNAMGTSRHAPTGRFVSGAPTVSGVSPAAGAPGAGEMAVITGEGFVGGDRVDFGSAPSADVSVVSPTSLEAAVPAGNRGSVGVKVSTPEGTSAASPADLYAYGAPTVAAVAPDLGPVGGGTAVTITGTGFVPGAMVMFGRTPAPAAIVNATGTSLEVPAPSGSVGSADITVTTGAGTSAISTADLFAYGAPVVTGDIAGAGPMAGGNDVIVGGTGFVPGITVHFGVEASPSATVLPGGTALVAAAPPGAPGPVDITVTTPQGTSATSLFDAYFYGPPTVTGLAPAAGGTSGGTAVTITGTGFSLGSKVSFGLQKALSVTVNSATSITAISPAANPGSIAVRVSTPAGLSPATAATFFTYDDQSPPTCSAQAGAAPSPGTPCHGAVIPSLSAQGQRQRGGSPADTPDPGGDRGQAQVAAR